MKVLKSDKIKRIEERATSQDSSIFMENLMENAGYALFEKVKSHIGEETLVTVLCGKGNNGGDGFVLARLLTEIGVRVKVVLACGEPGTPLSRQAYDKIPAGVEIINTEETSIINAAVESSDIIVDAVFGFGFKGELRGRAREILAIANKAIAVKISADVPSGAECDTARVSADTFKADYTVTFNCLKIATVSYPAKEFCGKVSVENVGIPQAILDEEESDLLIPDDEFVRNNMKKFGEQSNKGTRGRLLCVCGSYGMAGACIMAGKAALRSGTGLVDIALDRSIYQIVAARLPEAVFTVIDNDLLPVREALEKADACIIGCGIGIQNIELLELVLENSKVPILLDADALNIIAEKRELISKIQTPWIMTPHPGEMSRLIRKSIRDIQNSRIETANDFAREYKGTVLLKGAGTVIADGKSLAVNTAGNNGMAKGGSGDVLSGIIGAFLAQGCEVYASAVMGAYIHARAGDMCKKEIGEVSMQPTDMINYLSPVFKEL